MGYLRDVFFSLASGQDSAKYIRFVAVETPLGPITLAANGFGLCLAEFADNPRSDAGLAALQRLLRCDASPGVNAHIEQASDELRCYFAGSLTVFDVPLVYVGTPFQRAVWDQLRRIPFGETRSYGAIAGKLGQPRAGRAVGAANGRNRLAIFVPCQRLVCGDGRLTGYGGGLWRKQALLDHERSYCTN